MKQVYQDQVRLLLEVLTFVRKYEDFAVKGGTALNLFYNDMPRLSVDIDLTYLPIKNRQATYSEIHRQLSEIKQSIETDLQATVFANHPLDGQKETRLIVEKAGVRIKVEPNYVIRGALFPPETRTLSKAVQEQFQMEVEAQCLSKADLVGGKICATLDRQHPRDLFDVHLLLQEELWPREYTDAFIFYLISCPRPFHEMLDPNFRNIKRTFESEFQGMTDSDITLEDLVNARSKLVAKIKSVLNQEDQDLLLSITYDNPFWQLFCNPEIKSWPSVMWKMMNIGKMTAKKRENQWHQLQEYFEK